MSKFNLLNAGRIRQTISVRVLPCTGTLPTRLVAKTSGGSMSIVRSVDSLEQEYDLIDIQQLIPLIGIELAKKMEWSGDWAVGATKDGWVLVNVSS